MPELANDMLSDRVTSDQTYLYKMALAIESGICSERLSKYQPGPVYAARWYTTASRILRLYISTQIPSNTMKLIVRYILHVYLPMWLHIRKKPYWNDGPSHVQRLLTFSRDINSQIHLIVIKKIVNNSYYLHPENILLSMITDSNPDIRSKAYNRILSLRNIAGRTNNPPFRIFRKPTADQINESSEHYSTLIDWDNFPETISEPPYTIHLTNEELHYYKNSENILNVPKIPCHSQHTEFYVQVVSNVVSRVAGIARQNAEAQTVISSRQEMPRFESKQDFTF